MENDIETAEGLGIMELMCEVRIGFIAYISRREEEDCRV
jgi:hypothetical protein